MIGPTAYEIWFQTKHDLMKEYAVKHKGMRYIYCYDWEILSMFDSTLGFKNWCFADMMDNGGEYADRKEVVE
tara:strand:- start:10258 stop:10473 length:216 start_codon:yes stop_codon:yes gene_type:complete